MAFNWITSRLGSALPLIAIGLALANWNAKPAAAWAWAAVIVMSVVMVVVQRFWELALSRSPGNTALARSVDSVAGAVVFGALMMIIPLALTLAHAYGLVDDPTGGRRASMIICGAYLVLMGNAMPRALPPVTSKPRLDALIQAFHRRAGWTWVLCGLAFLTASLALPIKTAGPVSMALVGAAMIATVVQLLRLARQTRQHAPGLN